MNDKFLEGAKKDLLSSALDYARAKKFGSILQEGGVWESWCPTDQKMYEDNYLRLLGQAAVRLLMEITTIDPGQIP
jgi:hypothetical protein